MRYISVKQYEAIKDIPRGRLTARYLIYVGAIIAKKEKILLCLPNDSKYPGWQLPGGKVLWSENIKECLIREVLEETGLEGKVKSIVGIFQRETTPEDEEYLRVIFTMEDYKKNKTTLRDPAIESTKWFSMADILDGHVPLQSQQIIIELKHYKKGIRYPLEMLGSYKW